MNFRSHSSFGRIARVVFAATTCVLQPLDADVVETLTGSTIHGRIVASESGVIKVETDFADTIAIKREQIKSIVTDTPIHLALADGVIVNGRIERSGPGLRVIGPEGALQTVPTAIDAVWREGDKSPAQRAAEAMQRKWGYEVALDINGRNGNSDRLFLGLSGRAVLQGIHDRLMFFGNYSRSEENEVTTQDEGKGGIDYSNFFSPMRSWYVRSEIGYDRTKDLDLRSQSAAGLGYTFIKNPSQMLEGRLGLSYRFEDHGTSADFESAGVDLGMLHTLSMGWGRLTNTLSYTPSFEDFSNFVFIHDSAIELPVVGNKPWRVRVGVKTDYSSEPPAGVESLDWTYYTQFVLSWQ